MLDQYLKVNNQNFNFSALAIHPFTSAMPLSGYSDHNLFSMVTIGKSHGKAISVLPDSSQIFHKKLQDLFVQ